MHRIPIFVINLDTQPERLSYMMATLGALELKFIRVRAVDGSKGLDAHQALAFSLRRSGYRWSSGEIGCLLSHASIWQRMVDETIPHALIFEDDVRIARNLPAFLRHVDALPDNTHAVKLETLNDPIDIDEGSAGIIGPVEVGRLRSKHLGSAGYLLTLAGARAFLDIAREPRLPVDHHMFDPLLVGHGHLVVYQAVPALVAQRGRAAGGCDRHAMFASVIDSDKDTRHQKAIPLGEKVLRELTRPWRQAIIAARRLVRRRLHRAKTTVVTFIGDGVLDDYLAKTEAAGPLLTEIARRLRS